MLTRLVKILHVRAPLGTSNNGKSKLAVFWPLVFFFFVSLLFLPAMNGPDRKLQGGLPLFTHTPPLETVSYFIRKQG